MASVEAYVGAWEAKPSAWLGGDGGGGFASGSRAERVSGLCRTPEDFEDALLRWSCGSDHPQVREAVWARLMAVGSRVAAESPRRWPKGMLLAMTALAMAELWPRRGAAPWADVERRAAMAAGMGTTVMDPALWHRCWKPRYLEILDEARRCIGRAEQRVTGRRWGLDE